MQKMPTRRQLSEAYNDFGAFCQLVWDYRDLNDVAPIDWVEHDVIDFIINGPRHSVLLAWRFFGKTNLICANLPIWFLLRNRNHKTLIMSKGEKHAVQTTSLIKQIITGCPWLSFLKPSDRDETWTTKAINVAGTGPSRIPSIQTVGIGGMIEGIHADLVIVDDVESKSNTITFDARETLDDQCKQLKAVCNPGGKILYVGTYQHEDSLYLKLNQRGYEIRTYPMLYPGPDDKCVNLAKPIQDRLDSGEAVPGDIVADYRVDMQQVADQKKEGKHYFSMQFMLSADLGDSEEYPLRLHDLIVFDFPPDSAPIRVAWGERDSQNQSTIIEDIPCSGFDGDCLRRPIMFDALWQPFTKKVMWIDPAGAGKDRTAYCIASFLNGYIYIHKTYAYPAKQGSSPSTMRSIAQAAQEHKVRTIHVEDAGMQIAWIELLKNELRNFYLQPGDSEDHPNGWSCHVEPTRRGGQKEVRIIEALEPVMSNHRLIVKPEVVKSHTLQYQLTRITKERGCLNHEDELEAMAMAVSVFRDKMSTNPDTAAARSRARELEDYIKRRRKERGEQLSTAIYSNEYNHRTGGYQPKTCA